MAARPRSLPARYRKHWDQPWTARARNSPGFRRYLAKHGYLTPHFTLREAASKDGASIPRRLRPAARNHAFRMEVLRHALVDRNGRRDRPVTLTSWYRSPSHNKRVGGAAKSVHMKATATDLPLAYVQQFPKFDAVANRIFRKGGFGQYPGGARHVDSRGFRARWTTFTPGR